MTDPNAANQETSGSGEGATRPGSGSRPEDGPAQAAVVRLLLIAAVLGIVATFAAVLFEIVVHGVQNLMWTKLPGAAGWKVPPLNHSPWQKLAGQKSPSAAAPQDVKDSVEDMPQTMYLRSSTLVGRPNVGLDALPFGIGKIGWVSPSHEKKRTSSLSRTD